MQRRTALKNIGLSLGGLTLTPTVVGLLQSCQQTPAGWSPAVIPQEQYNFLTRVIDVILPTTPNVPGATDLNLMAFIDGYFDRVASEEDKAQFLMGADIFTQVATTEAGKDSTPVLTNEDIDNVLAAYFRATPETQAAREEAFTQYLERTAEGTITEVPVEGAVHTFLHALRSISITAFKTNAIIGEEHLAYAPVPGQQQGCVDLQEASEGKAWAL